MFDPVWQYIRSDGFDIYRLRYARGRRVLIAKCVARWNESAYLSLCNQFAALSKIHSLAGDQLAGTVPEPIVHLKEQRILLMSEVPGISLERELHRHANVLWGWISSSRMQQMGHAVGTWLKVFHHVTSGEVKPFNCHEYANGFYAHLSLLTRAGMSDKVLERLRQAALRQSRTLDGTPMCMAAAHGELLPQNILIHGSRAGVVDFDYYIMQAPVYEDVSTMLGYLKLLGTKAKYSRKALALFSDSFVSGYGASLNVDLLRLFMVKAMLKLIHERPPKFLADVRVVEEVLTNPTSVFKAPVSSAVPVSIT